MIAHSTASQGFGEPAPDVEGGSLWERRGKPASAALVPQSVTPVYFNPKDAAAYLTISPRTRWEETQKRRIKAVRVGRRLIYPRAELDRFIAVRLALSS
jgi:excisionase family DNA binding protein